MASVWPPNVWLLMVIWPADPGADPTSGLADLTVLLPFVAEGICEHMDLSGVVPQTNQVQETSRVHVDQTYRVDETSTEVPKS